MICLRTHNYSLSKTTTFLYCFFSKIILLYFLKYKKQNILVAGQRGNAVAVLGTILVGIIIINFIYLCILFCFVLIFRLIF